MDRSIAEVTLFLISFNITFLSLYDLENLCFVIIQKSNIDNTQATGIEFFATAPKRALQGRHSLRYYDTHPRT